MHGVGDVRGVGGAGVGGVGGVLVGVGGVGGVLRVKQVLPFRRALICLSKRLAKKIKE